jgi:hypothetical protein
MKHNNWFKSSHSSGGDNCVEVKHTERGVLVRHSKHTDGPTIGFSPDEWSAFLSGVKAGEFDRA